MAIAASASTAAAMRPRLVQGSQLTSLARTSSGRPLSPAVPSSPGGFDAAPARHFIASSLRATSHAKKGDAAPEVVWVKFSGGRAFQVVCKRLENITDLIKATKRELTPKLDAHSVTDIDVYLSSAKEPLCPSTSLAQLAIHFLDNPNSKVNPLIIKLLPPPEQPTRRVTLIVQDGNAKAMRIERVLNETLFNRKLARCDGFKCLEDETIVLSFDELRDGMTYEFVPDLAVANINHWRQYEANEMEAEAPA